jgi:hypothetical protein
VDTQLVRAQQLLTQHRTALESFTADLLKSENLDGSAVRQTLERGTGAA